jgi:pimeloyl-ACP methyl ester carboxylesterase
MKPVSSGYADVNGINLYHEIYGQGEPLVLIHGGLTTIGEMQVWLGPLAKTRQVIAVEMQGHRPDAGYRPADDLRHDGR